MVVQIVVEHSVKSGREQEVLDVIRELNLRGYRDQADMLLSSLLLQGDTAKEEIAVLPNDEPAEVISGWASLLKSPAKIRLRLSS